jgi:hypothetical protein
MYDEAPREPDHAVQIARLSPLKRLLELDGFKCRNAVNVAAAVVPLMAERGGRGLAVAVQSGLLRKFC